MYIVPATKKELLTKWHKRLRETQESHYEAAKPLSELNYKLGIPVVILTAIVGTSVFATLSKNVEIWIKITVGLISVTATVLSSIQTFLKFSERADAHRKTASSAGIVRREIEQLLASGDIEAIAEDKLNSIRERIDKVSENAPSVKESIWGRAVKRLEE